MRSERVFGIVGGTGPESTIDYYRSLGATWRRRRPDGTHPRVIIDSVDGGTVIRLLGEGEYTAVGQVFGAAIEALAAAGCGAALIASNLGHMAFDALDPAPAIPLIHRGRGPRRGDRRGSSAGRDHRHAVRRRVTALPGPVRPGRHPDRPADDERGGHGPRDLLRRAARRRHPRREPRPHRGCHRRHASPRRHRRDAPRRHRAGPDPDRAELRGRPDPQHGTDPRRGGRGLAARGSPG